MAVQQTYNIIWDCPNSAFGQTKIAKQQNYMRRTLLTVNNKSSEVPMRMVVAVTLTCTGHARTQVQNLAYGTS